MNLVDLDDRSIKASEAAGRDLKSFTEEVFASFLRDCEILGVDRADSYPRTSDHVPDMIRMAERLADKGAAYEKLRSLYFDISRDKHYGELSGVDLSKIQVGRTVDLDVYEKENPRDFSLFRRATLAELKKGLYANTPWGAVRPSWHIQCAAISGKLLGDQYDIHTGGKELGFPHYENVNAIAEAAHGHSPARYWVHSELVLVDGAKMSRIQANAPSVSELIQAGFDGRAIRYWLMSTHYRKPLAYSEERLRAAASTLNRLDDFINRVTEARPGPGAAEVDQFVYDLRQRFRDALDDDLNVAGALSALFEFIRRVNPLLLRADLSRENLDQVNEVMTQVNEVLNILNTRRVDLSEAVKSLLARRELARAAGDWAEADRLRAELAAAGGEVIDTPAGQRCRPAR